MRKSRGKTGEEKSVNDPGAHVVVGDRTAGRFNDSKQGSLTWPEVVFMLVPQPKSRSKSVDRAFIKAKKRVTTVEQRDAGKVERERQKAGRQIDGSANRS